MQLAVLQSNAEAAAGLLKSLANPSRLLVLCALVTREHTVSELEDMVGLSQSALSQHLARLREEKIVTAHRQGQRVYYSLSHSGVQRLLAVMHDIYCADLNETSEE